MVKRIVQFLAGVFIMGNGVAITIRSGLGTTPINSVPLVAATYTGISVGVTTMILNLLFVVAQFALLRRNFAKFQWVQLIIAIVFGSVIDLGMTLTGWLHPQGFFQQWTTLIIGTIVVGFGVWLEVHPHLSYVPGEGLVTAITYVTKKKLGTIKIIFDWSLVLIAIAASFILMGELVGVREGTIVAAFGTGYVVRLSENIYQYFKH